MKTWTVSNIEEAIYIGIIEFLVGKEWHNFEVLSIVDRLVFGGHTNTGFLESGYILKDGFSVDETLQELQAELEVYYREGKEHTSQIVVNERM